MNQTLIFIFLNVVFFFNLVAQEKIITLNLKEIHRDDEGNIEEIALGRNWKAYFRGTDSTIKSNDLGVIKLPKETTVLLKKGRLVYLLDSKQLNNQSDVTIDPIDILKFSQAIKDDVFSFATDEFKYVTISRGLQDLTDQLKFIDLDELRQDNYRNNLIQKLSNEPKRDFEWMTNGAQRIVYRKYLDELLEKKSFNKENDKK